MAVPRDDRWSNRLGGLAVLAAVLLVSPALAPHPLVLDEHVAYWLCSPNVELSIAERSLNYAAAPPMTSWLQAASLAAFGHNELALRLPSLALYVLAVVVFFLGSRPVIGAWPAALSSLALAWHPDVVDEVRIGRPYGLVLFAMSAVLVCTLRLLSAEDRTSNLRWGIGWGIASGVAMWAHILTLPVLGCTGLVLLLGDWRRHRFPQWGTIVGTIISVVASLPLWSMILRMWNWREALNYQTGHAPMWQVFGPFLCFAIPVGMIVAASSRLRDVRSNEVPPSMPPRLIGACLLMGVVPLIVLAFAAEELSSLNNPRYRVPLAAAQAMLLGILLSYAKPTWAIAGGLIALGGAWGLVGRLPTTLNRLETPQAIIWKEIGETLRDTITENELESAPVFVQSGLIEGTLVPLMVDDASFHEYVSSRLGRFYADCPNSRFGLPFFWHINTEHMQKAYRSLVRASPSPRHDIFVAAAVDTDVNRSSLAGFAAILHELGYELTPLADRPPWAVLYHARQHLDESDSQRDQPKKTLP